MKKGALQVFKQGLKHPRGDTREVCKKALSVMRARTAAEPEAAAPKKKRPKVEIREIPSKSRKRHKVPKEQKNSTNLSRS
jgi:hypothetical protein